MMPVYFIQAGDGGPIKIGFAKDVKRRLTKMQADNHERLRLRVVLEGDREEETRLHRQFYRCRLFGEWFHPSTNLLQYIKGKMPETILTVVTKTNSLPNNVSELIDALGGTTAVAKIFGVLPSAVSNWRAASYFPARLHYRISREAATRGIELDEKLFTEPEGSV